jgi:hypothetical protein
MSRKKCFHCQFSVPSNASVCGHCGAEFRKVADKSITARISSAIGNGFMAGLICIVVLEGILPAVAKTYFPALLKYETTDEETTLYTLFAACAGALYGLFKGEDKEITRR